MKLIQYATVLFSLCGGLVFTGWAQEEPDPGELNEAVDQVEKEGEAAGDQDRVFERISNVTGVETETLRQQREETQLGFGGLAAAHLIAQETGQSFEDVVARHQEGAGWGEIAKESGAKLGPLMSNMKRARDPEVVRENRPADAMRKPDASPRRSMGNDRGQSPRGPRATAPQGPQGRGGPPADAAQPSGRGGPPAGAGRGR